jgi:tRNA nucleotidyltransferase/poly(A) polymerase
MGKVSAANVEKSYQDGRRLLEIFRKHGFQARFAGGCVRDRVLGLTPKDFDIATTALPREIIAVADREVFKSIPTGLQHGTVTIVVDGTSIEVTTLRKDVKTFGRKAEVSFNADFEEDAARRDFTINALYEGENGEIYDFFGGLKDIEEGRLRFVGEARLRIKEDYLRVLRFFRFWARFGFEPDQDGLKACEELYKGLTAVSQERITFELLEILKSKYFAKALTKMREIGLTEMLLPGVSFAADNLHKMSYVQDVPDDLRGITRLSVAFKGSEEEGAELGKKLKLSNRHSDLIAFSVSFRPKLARVELMNLIDKIENRLGHGVFLSAIIPLWLAKYPESKAEIEGYKAIETKFGDLRTAQLPIDGAAIQAELQLPPGPQIGIVLGKLKDAFRAGEWRSMEEGLTLARENLSLWLQP